MDQAGIVTLIDEALERFAGRDLRLVDRGPRPPARHAQRRVSDAAIAALIDSEAQPAH